jgi:ribosomal protein S18 acetylase RimI-like enzyme
MAAGTGITGVQIQALESTEHIHQCAEFMAVSEPWKTLRRTYEEGVAMLNDPNREAYAALVDGQLAGFTILRMDGAFVGYIQTIGVLPQWQSRGIGSKLMAFAEERIFRDTPNAFICVSSFNPKAQKLYKKLGYETVGELTEYIVPGHSEFLMRKTIAPLTEFKRP